MPSHSLYHKKFDGCRKHAVSDKDTRADRDARCRAHKHTCRRDILRVAYHAVIPARLLVAQTLDGGIQQLRAHSKAEADTQDGRFGHAHAAEHTEQDDVERRRHVHAEVALIMDAQPQAAERVQKALAQFSDILFHGSVPRQAEERKVVLFFLARIRRVSSSLRSWS